MFLGSGLFVHSVDVYSALFLPGFGDHIHWRTLEDGKREAAARYDAVYADKTLPSYQLGVQVKELARAAG